jgi:hypothetical protein
MHLPWLPRPLARALVGLLPIGSAGRGVGGPGTIYICAGSAAIRRSVSIGKFAGLPGTGQIGP